MNQVSPPVIDKGDADYRKDLKTRHMRMIALGGAIGSGLFYGASERIFQGGPSVALVYALCGMIAYLMLRALSEMAVYRPSSGGYISYAREFLGERGAFFTGWFAVITYSSALMADITAIANYMWYWKPLQVLPLWAWALIALTLVVIINLASVKFFGEFEFWFAMIKIVAIVIFMVLALGTILLGYHMVVDYQVDGVLKHGDFVPGYALISEHGGWFPTGAFTMITMSLGCLFAYGGSEYIGLAAGEASDPTRELPRAVNSMMWRILLFYVGCIILFTLLLPHYAYDPQVSPFVTFFTAIGIPLAGDIMNLVVLIAAASAINAALYTSGRGLRSLAMNGSAPKILRAMNRNAVPAASICAAALIGLVGVFINLAFPSKAFEIIAYIAGIGICTIWGSIMISNLVFVRKCRAGLIERPSFHLPFAPYTNYLVLLILFAMIVLMWWEGGMGPIAIITFIVITLLLGSAWLLVRKNSSSD